MQIEWSAAERAFQEEVRAFLQANLTDELRTAGRLMTSVYCEHAASMQWQRVLHEKGWAAPAWPTEYGGCDWTAAQHYIFACERAAACAPPLSPMGIQMCAPALVAFGTAEQKQFFLPRMLSGEHLWCQGYSEPQSGSDLASLQMAAVEDGNEFVCTGSKIWTTHATEANWIFCLVRTSREQRPQLGITFLLIDLSSPGIEIKPIVSSAGEHIQNQIFFSSVRVPRTNVVGQVGAGWTVAKYLLEFERGGVAYSPELKARLAELREFAASAPAERQPPSAERGPAPAECGPRSDERQSLLDDPLFAARLAAASIRVAALEVFELQALCRISAGGSPGSSASVMKIIGTELRQHVTELALEAAGHYGRAYQPQAGHPGGRVCLRYADGDAVGPTQAALAPLRYFNERAGSIYAGSNEIQRNILAKSALGL